LVGPAKSKKILPALVSALRDDPEAAIRAGAAQALGRICIKCRVEKQDFTPGREALFTALRTDSSGLVREGAAIALTKLDVGEVRAAVPALIERLKDDYPDARAAAAATLFYLGKEAADAVPALSQALEDAKNSRTMRIWAAKTLGKISAPEAAAAFPAMLVVLTDEKTPIEIRSAIIEVLGAFGKDAAPAVPLLGKLLTDESSTVELRGAVVTALEQLGPNASAALPALKKAVKDRDKFVRSMALRTFGKIGKGLGSETKEVAALLILGTDDALLEVRLAAIETLGNLGADVLGDELKAVRERLMQLSDSAEKDVREGAQGALKKLES
jgi:HEAT repeat protein